MKSEWTFRAEKRFSQPTLWPEVFATVTSPDGEQLVQPLFYAGDGTWKLRLYCRQAGEWSASIQSIPRDAGLCQKITWQTAGVKSKGMLRAAAGQPWEFRYDDGSVPLLIGDTQYNLFAAAHSGLDVEAMLRHRKTQGFNHVRARLATSPFHPHTPFSDWMKSRAWLWGGSPQCPEYDKFNQDYFDSIERTLDLCASMEISVELIIEAWLMESPFNDRSRFKTEHEELLFRETVARLGYHPAIAMWCVANEYNLYTENREDELSMHYSRRLGRLLRQWDGHRHPIANHVTAAEHLKIPFGERFRDVPEIDVLLMQYWGDISTHESTALGLGMDEELKRSIPAGLGKARIMSEYGYENSPSAGTESGKPVKFGPDHSRRCGWRSLMQGLPIIHGFDNTWGPKYSMVGDPPGAAQYKHMRTLLTETLNFRELVPNDKIICESSAPSGYRPLALSNKDGTTALVYLPTGGSVKIDAPLLYGNTQWIDPRTGASHKAEQIVSAKFMAPEGKDAVGLPQDWLLLLRT